MLSKKVSWGLLGLVILLEKIALLQNIRFWTSAAYSNFDVWAHVGMAIATSLGLIAATAAASQAWHRSKFIAWGCASFVAMMCAAFSIFAQCGSFAFQEWSAQKDEQEIQEARSYQEQSAQLAISDATASRQAVQSSIDSIDAQIAAIQNQMQAFGDKGMLTNGWKPANDTLNALVNQKTALTQKLASIETRQGEAPSENPLANHGRNAFSSLFSTIAPAFNADEKQIRAWFFLLVPVICVLMTVSCVVVLNTPENDPKAQAPV